jgi:hypothetical protein
MSDRRISLRKWIEQFDSNKFESEAVDTQIEAGWYDWFCSSSRLKSKTYKMAPMIVRLSKSDKINIDTTYVFFKNNCPLNGPLYDSFVFCDIATGDVIFDISPKCTHTNKAELWGRSNAFDGAIISGTMKDIYKFFGV